MKLHLLLERLNLRYPGHGEIRSAREQMIPAIWRIRRREGAEELDNPIGGAVESGTDPIALRIRGTTCMGLHECRAVKAAGKRPYEFQCGAALHIKELQDHGATLIERSQARKRLRDQEALDRILLSIEIRAEIEAAVRRIHVGPRHRKRVLILQTVEIPRAVGPIGDIHLGIALEKRLGLAPARNRAFRRFERHRGHRNRGVAVRGNAVLNRFQKSTGSFSGMRRGLGGEAEEVPHFYHLEVAATERLRGRDGPRCATL